MNYPKVDPDDQSHRSKVKVTRSKKVILGLIGRLTDNIEGQGSHGSRSKATWVKSHEGQGQHKGKGHQVKNVISHLTSHLTVLPVMLEVKGHMG